MSENFIGTVRVLTAEEAKKRRGNTLLRLQEKWMDLIADLSLERVHLHGTLRGKEEMAVGDQFVSWLTGLGYGVVAEKGEDLNRRQCGYPEEKGEVIHLVVSWGSDL